MISRGLDNNKTESKTIKLSIIPDKNKHYRTGFSKFGLAVHYSEHYKHYGEGKK